MLCCYPNMIVTTHQNFDNQTIACTKTILLTTSIKRPQKHNYVCSEERTVVRRAVLTRMEVRIPLTSSP